MATYATRGGVWLWQSQHASTTLSNHLYGAERLGILQVIDEIVSEDPAASVTAVNTLLDANGYTTHDDGPRPFQVFHTFKGEKQYEITNHLGNVMVVVKEQPLTLVNNGVFQLADVVSATDYFPFGLQMTERVYEAGRYGFGFNGKINDEEILSNGRWQDYGFRAYRSDIGRFVSVDPLRRSYPSFTVYSFVNCNPMLFVDIDGRCIYVAGKEDRALVVEILVKSFGKNASFFEFNADNELIFTGDPNSFPEEERSTVKVLTDIIAEDMTTEIIFVKNASTDKHSGEATATITDFPNAGRNVVYIDPIDNFETTIPWLYDLYFNQVEGAEETSNPDKAKLNEAGYPIKTGNRVTGRKKVNDSRAARFFHGLGHVLHQNKSEQEEVIKVDNNARKIFKREKKPGKFKAAPEEQRPIDESHQNH
jgi:RHS repeat-associated protein